MTSSTTTKCALVVGAVMLCAGSIAAQQAPASPGEARRGADPGIIVKPPDNGDPRLLKPAPPHKDQGLIEKPPADAAPDNRDRARPRAAPPSRPRPDLHCKGPVEDCRR